MYADLFELVGLILVDHKKGLGPQNKSFWHPSQVCYASGYFQVAITDSLFGLKSGLTLAMFSATCLAAALPVNSALRRGKTSFRKHDTPHKD